MEVRSALYHIVRTARIAWLLMLIITAGICSAAAQSTGSNYVVKDGKMQIELSKHLSESALDSFIARFDLFDLDLKQFIKTNVTDSLRKQGWKLEKNDRDRLIISKLLKGFDKFYDPA